MSALLSRAQVTVLQAPWAFYFPLMRTVTFYFAYIRRPE